MAEYQHPAEKNMMFSNLVEVARYRAAEQDQKNVYTFLAAGADQERHLTYGELDRKARAIAAVLAFWSLICRIDGKSLKSRESTVRITAKSKSGQTRTASFLVRKW